MKQFILFVTFIALFVTSYAQVPNEEFEYHRQQQRKYQAIVDTIINNGDGKVVIIDKRPKTIVNRPITPKVEAQPIIIHIEPVDLKHLVPDQPQYDPYTGVKALLVGLTVLVLICLILWTCGFAVTRKSEQIPGNTTNSPPIVNHFNVSGGYSNSQSVTDNSMSNYESYKTPDISMMFVKKEAEKPADDQVHTSL